ncbi:MAG: hypothetical protein IPK17_38415 [Chloroflexi bacterium]|uniref:hypothetical protein n=1 Tax=Candidatus Flexifilum breve TaxID=3140694 RepID=UPI003136422A|nr:hypothetical protein [Chloroflexota bacterium]
MNRGTLGLNIRQGVNNDNVAAYHRDLKPHTSLVHDEAKLVTMLQAASTRVIWRATGDDPLHSPLTQSPTKFVRRRFEAVGGNGQAIIHLTNEIGQSQAHDTWTLAALAECERLGIKACIFNHYTHTPYAVWMRSAFVLRAAADNLIGAHVYWNGAFPAHADDDTHAWLQARDQVGGEWVVTELGYAGRRADGSLDPNQGWQGQISEAAYIEQLGRAAGWYAQQGVPVCLFSWGKWP